MDGRGGGGGGGGATSPGITVKVAEFQSWIRQECLKQYSASHHAGALRTMHTVRAGDSNGERTSEMKPLQQHTRSR